MIFIKNFLFKCIFDYAIDLLKRKCKKLNYLQKTGSKACLILKPFTMPGLSHICHGPGGIMSIKTRSFHHRVTWQ